MTIDQLRAIVRQVSYKPNYRLTLNVGRKPAHDAHGLPWACLVIRARLPDARASGEAEVSFAAPIVELESMSEHDVLQWIFGCLLQFETHEVKEWFRCRGDVVFSEGA